MTPAQVVVVAAVVFCVVFGGIVVAAELALAAGRCLAGVARRVRAVVAVRRLQHARRQAQLLREELAFAYEDARVSRHELDHPPP